MADDPEEQAAFWVGAVTGREQPEGESLQAWLKSGVVLCELINTLSPGGAGKTSSSEVLASKPQLIRRMKEMENIAAYSEAARGYGVPESDVFVTFDLYEDKNFPAVVRNLHSLGRVAQQHGFDGPVLGAKLASKNVRTFSQAQLDQAKAMPAKWTNRGEEPRTPQAVKEARAAKAVKDAEEALEKAAEEAREKAGMSAFKKLAVTILGGTGKTGKWAVKGALLRGYKVRLLVRSKKKAEKVMAELFPTNSELFSAVTLVEGSVTEQSKLAELFTGADVVLSFLGMAEPPVWTVRPGAEAVLTALKAMRTPPKFVSMSSIGLGDSLEQANTAWSCCVVQLSLRWLLKEVFADMQAAEDHILATRSVGLNVVIVRATILSDKENYFKDYVSGVKRGYKYVTVGDAAKLSFTIDRQHVAEAFLDVCESSQHDNAEVSVFEA